MKQRIICLGLVLWLALSVPAAAAGPQAEQDLAADYLRRQQIMVGDPNGEMHLGRGLNRTELAVLLTRLHGGRSIDTSVFAEQCRLIDVPDWARPYVGYCSAHHLVAGYGNSITPELGYRKSGYVERKRRPYQENVVKFA